MRETTIVVATLAVLVSGCATPISPEMIASADYGLPPPANYQAMIRADFDRSLIDPTSPLYEFSEPSRGYTKASPLFGTKETFGWRVCGTLNSKNRFGGYVGRVPFFVLFRDGVIVSRVVGEIPQGDYAISIKNGAIAEACSRQA